MRALGMILILQIFLLKPDHFLTAAGQSPADTTAGQANSIIRELNSEAVSHFVAGNFHESENLYRRIVSLKLRFDPLDSLQLAAIYANMGVMLSKNWNFDAALEYYEKAENIYNLKGKYETNIADIITNKGNLVMRLGDPIRAINYYEQALRIHNIKSEIDDKVLFDLYFNLSSAALNGRITDKALEYLVIAIKHANNNKVSLKSVYYTYSRLYLMTKEFKKADKYFQKVMNLCTSKKDLNNTYINYGYFLISQEIDPERGFEYVWKGLDFYDRNNIYSPIIRAFAFQCLGIYYENKKDYFRSLSYYQKAIILTSDNFTDTSFAANPDDFTNLYDGRILYYLKSKARVLLRYHEEQRDIKYLEYSLNTILRAIDIINRMRYRYTSEASNFLISENEKYTFDLAENIAWLLYKKTGDEAYINQGFNINEQGRAFSLLSSIRKQRATEYGGIPIKILTEEKDLNRRLSLYEELIFQEKQLESPDLPKINNWQVLLFNAEQEYERFVKRLEKEFPGYYSLKYDRHVTGISEVMKKIHNNTALLQYSVLDSLLLIYYVSREGSGVVPVKLDTFFEKKCTDFFNIITRQSFSKDVLETYKNYTDLAHGLYQILIEPVEDKVHAENLIIIPDGTISYIPFDALVTSRVNQEKLNYRGLPYLVRKYSAGYSYSSTLHFNPIQHNRLQSQSVLAFAPSYPKARDINQEFQIARQFDPDNLLKLPGVKEEIRRISRIVDTEIFTDSDASERNFKKFSGGYRILHLAMHTLIDDENPMFSRLAFTNLPDTLEDNLLHTYEIYNMKFNASLAVLSSCSSGYGKMQEGEGIQSLARGFAYAGCPSILMTLWEVADHSTVFVMDKFYSYLKDHDPKPIALRKAKIEFLSSADQLKSNPFFWSSYVIIGDSNPIFPYKPGIIAANLFAVLLPLGYLGIHYIRYRNGKTKDRNSPLRKRRHSSS